MIMDSADTNYDGVINEGDDVANEHLGMMLYYCDADGDQ